MKPLLELTDIKYRRRMVREINSMIRIGQSVYVSGHPFNHRVKRAHLALQKNDIIVLDFYGEYRSVAVNDFTDGNGMGICASRVIR